MSARSSLSVVLVVWLTLSAARLVFDLVGKLWLVAIFDLLQIVCCITGLFGCLQKRRCLLVALLASNLLSTLQNTLLLLWYIGVFGAISRPVLSAGLPYSFSFFLRYTPACDAHFDLKRTIWVQHACLVPFHVIEAAQAVLHIALAISTTILAAILLVEIRRRRPKSTSSTPTIANQYAQISGKRAQSATAAPPPPPPIQPPPPIERVSKRKKRTMPAPDSIPCASENDMVEDVYTKPVKLNRHVAGSSEDRNLTSLVSFDPKSATLLRIRQHLEAEQGSNDDRQTITPSSTTYEGLYERLRSRGSPPSTIPLSDYKSRNASQDSVPSMFAPMLDDDNDHDNTNSPPSSSTSSPKVVPGPTVLSPGIRLSDQLAASAAASTGNPYKSAFRVQSDVSSDGRHVIGHYHAPSEMPLTAPPKRGDPPNLPVLTSGGLLV